MALRIILLALLSLVPAMSQEFKLIRVLPFQELKNERGELPEIASGRVSFPSKDGSSATRNEFGFVQLKSGLVFYTGFNGMVVDPETGMVSRALPANLASARISASGAWVIGLLSGEKRFWSMHKGQVREGKAGKWTLWMDDGWISPADDVFFAPDDATRYPYPPYGLKGVMVMNLDTLKVLGRLPIEVAEGGETEPTLDGRLVFGSTSPYSSYKAQNVRTGEWLKFDLPDEPYLGYVYTRDASWVAGGYAGGSTFIWDRKAKSFVWENRPIWDSVKVNHVWKDNPYGLPSAFSPNDQFLLCEGVVVKSATGEAAFRGLKGHRGKFSPDGRSLVTVDDEAFYIYTLPKDSEPIFGVFQKPKPWSPPKAKAKGKTR